MMYGLKPRYKIQSQVIKNRPKKETKIINLDRVLIHYGTRLGRMNYNQVKWKYEII